MLTANKPLEPTLVNSRGSPAPLDGLMKVYLDAKDLINILQGADPCTADQLNQSLQGGSHRLALSFYTVSEICVPLSLPASKTNVMAMLNRLEKMPIIFTHAGIAALELKEALDAFSSKREYRDIHPFVNRFDYAVDLHGHPPTDIFINYSLAETVWDLFSHGSLQGLESYAQKMRKLVSADRALKKPPSLKTNFAKMIERNLKLFNLSCSGTAVQGFANWVYDNPYRCPSIHVGYEVWHKIVKNKTDTLEDSDMEDYQHLACLPYVDLMTLDKRMCGYVSQASESMGVDYSGRIFRSVREVLCHL